MKRYWQILKKYKKSLLLSPFLILITVICETIQPLFMAKIVDDGVMEKNLPVVTEIGIYMVLISLLGLGVSILNVYISSKTSIGFGTDLRTDLFKKIQQLSFSDIDRFDSASLITRLTNDIAKIQQIVLMAMRIMLRSPLLLILALFFVLRIDPQLALILLAAIPILGIAVFIFLKIGFPLFLKVQEKVDQLNAVVRENLINMRVVKSFVREDYETKRFTKSSEDLKDMVIRASNLVVTIFPVMQLVMNISIVAILWFGGAKVISGELKVGELISLVNYLAQILMSLMMLSMVVMNFARAAASSRRVVEVLEAHPSLSDTKAGKENGYKINKGDIFFDRVSFCYPGGENYVLKDINFHINPSETVAIAGATGAAKSSMVQLIPRLYDVNKGKILIDGINIKDYNLDELHAGIGMVLQKNELFTGTILENLKWGKPDAGMDEIEEATRAAEAHNFIQAFPEGYNTLLGRGGVNLSGGQKQRICIARALLRKPKILILDDSTSAVDLETEQRIRLNLQNLLNNTTVLVVTQRITTMQAANRVIILDDGAIEAMGTPAELLEKSETYREIYNSQQIVI